MITATSVGVDDLDTHAAAPAENMSLLKWIYTKGVDMAAMVPSPGWVRPHRAEAEEAGLFHTPSATTRHSMLCKPVAVRRLCIPHSWHLAGA